MDLLQCGASGYRESYRYDFYFDWHCNYYLIWFWNMDMRQPEMNHLYRCIDKIFKSIYLQRGMGN